MSAFTPGPWRSLIDPSSLGDRVFATVAGKSVGVASVHSYRGRKTIDRTSRGANARLIAAAPDLYEAAQMAIESLEWDGVGTRPDLRQIHDKFRAALAKVDGQ